MSLQTPQTILKLDVLIEIPPKSAIKYEFEDGELKVDRILPSFL